MRNTSLFITVPHLFSPISAFSAESKSYIIALRFNVYGTLQINQTDFQISNSTSNQSLWRIITFSLFHNKMRSCPLPRALRICF